MSAWAWGLVVGAPGGLEQRADEGNIATLQSGPRERLEHSRRWRWARACAGKNMSKEIDRRECVGMGFSCGRAWRVRTKG